jgi:putative addiction module killer protein
MLDVQTTEGFDDWLDALDRSAQRRIAARLRKLSFGLWGDVKAVGEGVIELREHFGPGYRVYVTQRGPVLVVVLAGGDKSSQQSDIAQAISLARQL